MSDTMTSGEIEDVLSSIRRLVTEDLRPPPRSPVPQAVPKPKDRLILTPALRVEEPEDETPPELADDAAVASAEPAEEDPAPAFDPPPRLDRMVTAIGASVTALRGGWEAETGDSPVLAVAPEPDPAWPEARSPHEPERDAGDPVSAPAAQPPEADDLHGYIHRVAMDRAEAAARAEIEAAAAEQEVFDGSGFAAAPHRFVPDEDDAAFGAGFDMRDSGIVEAELAGPEAFDDEALREMIRDLIREELQGSLGERITRNIRKLVRAEINRALAARSFD